VVGQDHIVTTLRNALASAQVAHAYLFAGPRGTGKTTTARILARAVNCANLDRGEPCNECAACIAIGRGAALDLIEMDAASNRGIDDIRELREKIAFAPSDLRMKVYLLDEVHMLTTGAFNALLKTLEEPPPHAIFILATTESHEVPQTIISRCQRYDFKRVSNDAIIARLAFICEQEGYEVPHHGLLQVAIQSRGGLRDAITLLEQVVARYGPSPTTDQVLEALGLVQDERSETLARAIVEGDLATALDLARAVADDGVNLQQFTKSTLQLLREALPQLLRGKATPASPAEGLVQSLLSARTGPGPLVHAIRELSTADFKLDPASPLPLEVACAAAILGPPAAPGPAETHTATANSPAGQRPARGNAPVRPPTRGQARAAPQPGLTAEERFMRDLHESCRLANVKLSAWLNGSCKVISIGESAVELGFWLKMHMEKVDTDVRPLVEQQASALLKRPVSLKLSLLNEEQAPRRAARGGHLERAAKELGAVPISKDN
jgi:DNA polymerase-3 subunit gamma/tau